MNKNNLELNQEVVKDYLKGFKSTGRALINIDYTNDFVADDKNAKMKKEIIDNANYVGYEIDYHM